MSQPDLRAVNVVVVVFAMPGCGACDEYLPTFLDAVARHQRAGAPFHVWRPGDPIHPRSIPVLIYDAASEDDALQAFADQHRVAATPTTLVLGRGFVERQEGALDARGVDEMLYRARRAA